jgi:cobyrinic acid a,c-diamide synthase
VTDTSKVALSRIVVAGTHSGVGKTSVALGLIVALRALGLAVAPFKVGPDFIDPAFLTRGAGRATRNLDGWLLPAAELTRTLHRGAAGADLGVVEGMMGLYDGRSAMSEEGSTAAVAKLIDAPVLLVVDVSAAARSAAATVLGFQRFDRAVKVAGVVANGVGSAGHLSLVRDAITQATGLPVLGSLPRDEAVALPERHLGLVLPGELPGVDAALARLGALAVERFDLEAIRALAGSAPPLSRPMAPPTASAGGPRVRVAVAQDEAFRFYYPENLELLAGLGAEVVPFSPLRDAALPLGTRGMYLGGGYPELHGAALAANRPLQDALRAADASGMPIYAECGGLMYLADALEAPDGRLYPMVGVLPATVRLHPMRLALGYAEVQVMADTLLGPAGTVARGHEFHCSWLQGVPASVARVYRLRSGGHGDADAAAGDADAAVGSEDAANVAAGFLIGRTLMSYVHLHFSSSAALAPSFVSACASS